MGRKLVRLSGAGIVLLAAFGTAMAAAKGMTAAEGKAKLMKQLKAIQGDSFEFKNSDQDLVKGFTTLSKPAGDKFVAYVYLDWGDLNNLIKKGGKQYYSNWDGLVKVDGGVAEVVHKFAFDDGTSHLLNALKVAKAGRKRLEKGVAAGPHEGSGRDALIAETDPTEVAWQAGVVGATDGLLIKLTLNAPQAAVEVKAGKFASRFTLKPAQTGLPAGTAATTAK